MRDPTARTIAQAMREEIEAEQLLLSEGGIDVGGLISETRQRLPGGFGGGGSKSMREMDTELQIQTRQTMVAMGGGIGGYLAFRQLADAHTYGAMPAFQLASSVTGGYAQAVMEMMQEREQLLHDYGMLGVNIGMGAYSAVRAAPWVMRTLRGLSTARKFGQGVAVASAAAAPATGGATLTTLALAGLELLAVWAAEKVIYAGVRYFLEDRATRQAGQQLAVKLMDRGRLIDEYQNMLGMPAPPSGVSYHEYIKSMSTPLTLGFGYDYGNMGAKAKEVGKQLRSDDTAGFTTAIAETSSLYGFDTTQTFVSISRFLGNDIDEAKRQFETFFMAATGGGKPANVRLQVVESLAEFTDRYGFGTKFQSEAGDRIASIHSFMTDGMESDRLSTTPTETSVVGIDSMLSRVYSDPASQRFAARAGISGYDAIRGVTGDPETFDKVIRGLIKDTGIGTSSFDEDGRLNEEKSRELLFQSQYLGLDPQAMLIAVRSYIKGNRPGDAVPEFDGESPDRGEIAESSLSNLLGLHVTDQSMLMSEKVLESAHVMLNYDKTIAELFVNFIPNVFVTYSQMVATVISELDPSVDPSSITGSGALLALGRQMLMSTPSPRVNRFSGLSTGSAAAVAAPFTGQVANIIRQDGRATVTDFEEHMLTVLGGGERVVITTAMGVSYNPLGKRLHHWGMDVELAGGANTNIYFPFAAGTVVLAGSAGGLGNTVKVRFADGKTVLFGHMREVHVRVGQTVRYGDLLGTQGTTGYSTGEHVHIEFGDNEGEKVDDIERVRRMFAPEFPSLDSQGNVVPYTTSANEVHIDVKADLFNHYELARAVAAEFA